MVFHTTLCTTGGTITHFVRQATLETRRRRRAPRADCFAERLSSRCKYLFTTKSSIVVVVEMYLLLLRIGL